MEQNQYLDDVVIEDVYKIEQPKAENIAQYESQIEIIDEVDDSNCEKDSKSNRSVGAQKPQQPFFSRFLELAKLKSKKENDDRFESDENDSKGEDLNATQLNDSQKFCLDKVVNNINKPTKFGTLRSSFSSSPKKNSNFSESSSDSRKFSKSSKKSPLEVNKPTRMDKTVPAIKPGQNANKFGKLVFGTIMKGNAQSDEK